MGASGASAFCCTGLSIALLFLFHLSCLFFHLPLPVTCLPGLGPAAAPAMGEELPVLLSQRLAQPLAGLQPDALGLPPPPAKRGMPVAEGYNTPKPVNHSSVPVARALSRASNRLAS